MMRKSSLLSVTAITMAAMLSVVCADGVYAQKRESAKGAVSLKEKRVRAAGAQFAKRRG